MLAALQSQRALVFGVGLILLIVLTRFLTRDPLLRKDLLGALSMLAGFIAFRGLAHLLHASVPPEVHRGLTLVWMLALAFGLVRVTVASALFVARLRSTVPTPRILRDVLDASLYILATLPILHYELQLDFSGLVATSAIVSVVLGMALQDTLGNLFAGLSIQLDRPFQVGDVVTIRELTGKVLQIGWRATRVENTLREVMVLPNNMVAKEMVRNASLHARGIGMEVHVPVSRDLPPNRVKRALVEIAERLPGVAAQPASVCSVDAYEEDAVRYRLRLFIDDLSSGTRIRDAILSQAWYRFRREQRVPDPGRHEDFSPVLEQLDLLADLSNHERVQLTQEVLPMHFGVGEPVLHAGAGGDTFYIVAAGEVSVRSEVNDEELSRLRRGDHFGEMSLLTGAPRSANVVAITDCVLLEVQRATFARLFAEHPALAEKLSQRLAERRLALNAHAEAAAGAHGPLTAPESSRILARLRQIFGLRAG